eukprot:TRINITY_DN11932_c0_g1_i1.p3 TRINITY_DN11932_c0_g1~~TRINITY_DN11932_c0_g1_i1.p3  ORF type:complete len:103 (-),score=11.71 TRINITY_DN11932_c0_g1_i1:201-509(-)
MCIRDRGFPGEGPDYMCKMCDTFFETEWQLICHSSSMGCVGRDSDVPSDIPAWVNTATSTHSTELLLSLIKWRQVLHGKDTLIQALKVDFAACCRQDGRRIR